MLARALIGSFKNVNKGIIIEDDCIIHPHFFHFAGRFYKYDSRIGSISASNLELKEAALITSANTITNGKIDLRSRISVFIKTNKLERQILTN